MNDSPNAICLILVFFFTSADIAPLIFKLNDRLFGIHAK